MFAWFKDVIIFVLAVGFTMMNGFASIRSLLLPFWISSSGSDSFAAKIIQSVHCMPIQLLTALFLTILLSYQFLRIFFFKIRAQH